MSEESTRQKLERECADVEEFLMRFVRENQFTATDAGVEFRCEVYSEPARAIRKALRLGLAEMAKEI